MVAKSLIHNFWCQGIQGIFVLSMIYWFCSYKINAEMSPKSCHQFSDRYILSLRHVNVSLFSRKWQFIFTSIIDYLLQVGVLYYWNISSSWAVEQSTQLVVLLRSIKEAVNKQEKLHHLIFDSLTPYAAVALWYI